VALAKTHVYYKNIHSHAPKSEQKKIVKKDKFQSQKDNYLISLIVISMKIQSHRKIDELYIK